MLEEVVALLSAFSLHLKRHSNKTRALIIQTLELRIVQTKRRSVCKTFSNDCSPALLPNCPGTMGARASGRWCTNVVGSDLSPTVYILTN